ncbi:MAG: PAS-domain containing protein [Alphaproteobacteria bacterium]|nr:PAS-domain containing protein [Alphaproteobacteria bacterium]
MPSAGDRQKARVRKNFPAAELAVAFDCLRVALAVFDSQDRLIYANEQFRYLYRGIAAIDELVGMRFEQIMRLVAANGEIAGELAARDPDAWLADFMAVHRSQPFYAYEQRLADGRYLQIKERPTPEGGTVVLWVDVTEMMRHRFRLEDAMQSATEGFALWSQADKLLAHNDQFARLFGLRDRPLRAGQDYAEVFRAAVTHGRVVLPDEAGEWLASRFAAHRLATSRAEFQLPDGRWFQLIESRTRDGGTATVLTDVTALKESEIELRQRGKTLERTVHELEMVQVKTEEQATMLAEMAEELDSARREAERVSAYKTSFLRSITHELRTPLNAIIGFSELIQTESMGKVGNPKYIEYAELVKASGAHLLSLINQMLDLSRIEAGKMELDLEEHDLVDIVRYCAAMLSENAARAKLTLEQDLPARRLPVHVDLLAARQVVLNLLGNAIKFTEAGGQVTVAVSREQDSARVTIADTGVGIAEEDLPRLMEPFAQAGDILTRRVQGSGLGLAIAKALIELHGGRIAIASELHVGTRVEVTLPLARDARPVAAD